MRFSLHGGGEELHSKTGLLRSYLGISGFMASSKEKKYISISSGKQSVKINNKDGLVMINCT